MAVGAGRMNPLTSKIADARLPAGENGDEYDDRRSVTLGQAHGAAHPISPSAAIRARRCGRRLAATGLARPERLPDLGDQLEVARALARRQPARPRQVDVDQMGDRARPGAHDCDAAGEEHRLGDRVRHEDDRDARALPDARGAPSSSARGSSRRGRRTARPSGAATARWRGRARSPPVAACRRTAGTDGGVAKSARSTSCSISRARACRFARSWPSSSSGQLDVALDGPPVEQQWRLEDHSVVTVQPGLGCGLAVDQGRSR